MAKNILKEAIADAKAVREVALANAKAALEEAFTPKLQSMLSAKLSETLNEEEDELEENFMDETMDETFVEEEVMEISGMDEEEEGADLDEEIDLEEILNELELEEGEDAEETVDEAKDKDEETMDEAKDEEEDLKEMEVNHKAETANRADYKAEYVHEGNENFDLDALLEEINNLDENEEDEVNEGIKDMYQNFVKAVSAANFSGKSGERMDKDELAAYWTPERLADYMKKQQAAGGTYEEGVNETQQAELEETQAALRTVRTELNEVNLLNSKLLYVNRIFKANQLDEGQKLRVVETLDKAETAKEAKLIYETIKDTFTVANNKKTSFKNKTKSLKEGIGMASKAAGTSTAPKKEILSESNDMMTRFQKLANIKINQ